MRSIHSFFLTSGIWILASLNAHAQIDTNQNGMSDVWEKLHNNGQLFDPQNPAHAPTADPDGDGWTNLQESIAGTDPFEAKQPDGPLPVAVAHIPAKYEAIDPADLPPPPENPPQDPFDPNPNPTTSIPRILVDTAHTTLTWPTIPGKIYRVHASASLESTSWIASSEWFIGSGVPISYETEALFADGTVPEKLFWRIEIGDTDSDGDTLTDWEEYQLGTDPYHQDSDRDGIPDNLDPQPLVSATFADPDGLGLPASLDQGLIARWDVEQFDVVSPHAPFSTNQRFLDASGNNTHLVPYGFVPDPLGMPAGCARHGAVIPGANTALGGFMCPPRTLLVNRNIYSFATWLALDADTFDHAPHEAAIFSHHRRRPRPEPYGNLYSIDLDGMWIEKSANGQQTLKAGTYTYRNHVTGTNTPLAVPVENFTGVTLNYPEGNFTDGNFHHFLLVRQDAIVRVYVNGELAGQNNNVIRAQIEAPGDNDVGISIGRRYGIPAEAGIQQFNTVGVKGRFDRIRVWSRSVTAAEALALYRQDADLDGLWDITETKTRIWRDHNNDGLRQASEHSYLTHPLQWQPADTDSDGDGLSDIEEQTRGTDPGNPDTDGDLLPDGWEVTHDLDPLSVEGIHGASGDPEGDGLSNLDEYRYNSNPRLADSDGDGTPDAVEVANGSHPGDPSDNGQPLPSAIALPILLGIGDQSGSKSEDYSLHAYRIDPETGQETRHYTLRSGGHGQYVEQTRNIFRNDQTYTFQIQWNSTNNNHRPANTGQGISAEGPDYDYTFKVQPQGDHPGKLIDSWDPKQGAVTTITPLLADTASDVAETAEEFKENYESKRVALVVPKLEWKAIDGFENVDDHIDPWNGPHAGKRIFPCRKNPDDTSIRHNLHLVASGGLKGVRIFLKSFDIDDSTDEAFDIDLDTGLPVIDPNGKAGNDNRPCHYNTALAGQFRKNGQWSDNLADKQFDSQGRAVFEYKVGTQPGNNYRVIASVVEQNGYAGVQVTNATAETYLGPELSQKGGAIASEPLTVWRRLWVENDSMEAVNETGGPNANFFPVTVQYAVSDSLAPISDPGLVVVSEQIPHSTDQYENGFLRPASGGEWKVYRMRHFPNESQIVTFGTPTDLVGAAKLFDDDGRGLIEPQLPRLDLVNEELKSYFRSSFIEVFDAVDYNPTKFIPFKPNEDAFPTNTILDDARDLIDTPGLWVCTLVAAFQGAPNVDQDPENIGESLRLGETSGFNGNDQFSVVYVEACRESYRDGLTSTNNNLVLARRRQIEQFIIAVSVHEMGHHPGTQTEDEDHNEGMLMSEGLNNVNRISFDNAKFSPATVRRFRKANRWAN